MARHKRKPTFQKLLNEPTWSEEERSRTGANAVRPGGRNAAGEFFDPTGELLQVMDEDVTPEEAQRLVDERALVVIEECGCGGWAPSCPPHWLDRSQLAKIRRGPAPQFTGAYGAPSWIDVWRSSATRVVFAHGDVSWRNLSD